MVPPNYDLVVKDCDEALALDPKYVKALNRRAMALEGLDKLEDALRGKSAATRQAMFLILLKDFTAATILDKFQNQTTAQAVERVLKVLSTEKAKEIVKVCQISYIRPLNCSYL